jgi:hypothetical protein
LKFLHDKELNIRIDYKLFLSQVVKYLKYDTLVFYPLPANKERWKLLTDLWEEFLESRFVRDTSSFLEWENEILETFSVTLLDRRPVFKCSNLTNKLTTVKQTTFKQSTTKQTTTKLTLNIYNNVY